MADLSPAAQAVLDATFDHWPGGHNHPNKRVCLAAALRAVADQVIERVDPVECLYVIADELEGEVASEPREVLQWPRGWSRRQRRQEAERLWRNAGITGRIAEAARIIADAESGLPLQAVHDLIASYAIAAELEGAND